VQVVGSESDFFDRFRVVVDQDAAPVDWDEALTEFLLRLADRGKKPQFSPTLSAEQPKRRVRRRVKKNGGNLPPE
jgi:hypothetical protein